MLTNNQAAEQPEDVIVCDSTGKVGQCVMRGRHGTFVEVGACTMAVTSVDAGCQSRGAAEAATPSRPLRPWPGLPARRARRACDRLPCFRWDRVFNPDIEGSRELVTAGIGHHRRAGVLHSLVS